MGHAAQHSDFHMGEGAPSRKAETTHCPAVEKIAGQHSTLLIELLATKVSSVG
jgi:hypothetical protein